MSGTSFSDVLLAALSGTFLGGKGHGPGWGVARISSMWETLQTASQTDAVAAGRGTFEEAGSVH